MDRRSWLWRRKSSEKSPGETESSGSISSHSERFSDDQAYPTHASQSPEVTSKVVPNDEMTDNVKTLTEKLSAALLNIRAKDDLVKQHAKVAEEAVSGWEKAESEVLSLKQQLEVANQKNSIHEDRISHLDGALKECVRQLRQAREEQEQKIHEIVANKTREWESTKTELQQKIIDLEAQLLSAKADIAASISLDLPKRLEEVEKQNSSLKLELHSLYEELEFRIIERDLSTQAAETASKQHLESIKKVAKLEAELKALARKASPANDLKSITASSVCVESFTDSQSDSGERILVVKNDMHKVGGLELKETEPSKSNPLAERDQFENEKSLRKHFMTSSSEINLMDDFLEMERLAALPDTGHGSCCLEAGPVPDQPNQSDLEAMILKTSELEEKIKKMEEERIEVETAMSDCRKQLEASQSQLAEAELILGELQSQLDMTNKLRQDAYEELMITKTKNEATETELRVVQADMEKLISNIASLEEAIEKEQSLSAKYESKCRGLEEELSKVKLQAQLEQESETQHREYISSDLKLKQEKELAVAASRFAECQKTIASLGQQLKSLAALEDFLLESEKPLEPSDREGSESQQKSGEQLKLYQKDSNFPKTNSKSLNPKSIMHDKSRNGVGKVLSRSSRTVHTAGSR